MNKETQEILPQLRLDRKLPTTPQIYNQIRSMIMSLDLEPGASLQRSLLARRFGVSQQPIREALLKLEEEGLVVTYPQSSTKVSKIDMQRVHEAQILRLSIELEVVQILAAQANSIDFYKIDMFIDLQERRLEANDMAGFDEVDLKMHRAMLKLGRVPGLCPLIYSRSGHLDRLRRLDIPTPGKAGNAIKQHKSILRAIRAGDGETAQEIMRTHLSGTISSVDELRIQYPDYLSG